MAARKSRTGVNLDEFTGRISGRWAISYWQGLITLVIGFFANLNRGETILQLNSQEAFKFALMISGASTIAFIFVERVLLVNRNKKSQSFTKILYSYSAIWLITVLVESYVTLYQLKTTLYIGAQVIAPYAPTVFGLFIVAFIIGELSESKVEQLRLAELTIELQKLSDQLESELERERKSLLKSVKDALLPRIYKIKEDFRLLSSGYDIEKKIQLADEIESYSNDTVRQLSHEINTANKITLDTGSEMITKPISWRNQLYKPVIGVKSVLFVTLIVGGFQQLSTNGPNGFIFDAILSAYLVLANLLGRILLQKIERFQPHILWFIFIFHSTLTTFGAYQLEKIHFPLLPKLNFFSIGGFIAPLRLVIGSVLISILLSVASGHKKTHEDIVSINQSIANEALNRQKEILRIRSKLASTLHGPIQGRLAGIAMLIRLEAPDENYSNNNTSKIFESLNDIEKDLHGIFEENILQSENDLLSETLNLEKNWKNLVNFIFDIEESLFCFSDTLILKSLKEILNESVTNAVRHGKASEILVRIRESHEPTLKLDISIINNGISLEGMPKFGLGLNSISKVAKSWNIKNLEDGRVGLLASI